jgi:septum formation protein
MNLEKKLILGSNSPRRSDILKSAGFEFEIEVREIDETYSLKLKNEEIPLFLAKQKALVFHDIPDSSLVLTADTVVVIDNQTLNKPQNTAEATQMLKMLSNEKHSVYTACCIKQGENFTSFYDKTDVYFKTLTDAEIAYYIEKHRPFDKAGAYGVQDFIGMVGIEKIEGSFYTVMGLPIHLVYTHLKPFLTNL